jgi:uncharacterized protein
MGDGHPTFADGKICYVEIPAIDIKDSASFYTNVFGWPIRQDGHGNVAFDDTTGEVSGLWVTGRKPATEPGLLLSIMVANIAATIDAIVENGGEIVQPVDIEASEVTARFRDPAGNVISLYQESHLSKAQASS